MNLYRIRPLPVDTALNGYRLLLTTKVIELVASMLPKRVDGRSHENVLYLAGSIDGITRCAFEVVVPKAKTAPGSYTTSRDSHAEVLWNLSNRNLVVVGQVHCHPGGAVYHSDADDDLAFIKGEGFWSIVVPNYGEDGMIPLSSCGFHCYSNHAFRLLKEPAVSNRVIVAKDRPDQKKGGSA